MQGNYVVRLNFNKKFYKISSIRKAIKDFNAALKGNVKESNGYFCTSLKLKRKSPQPDIGHEFANYVLALMKNESIV